MIYDIAYKDTFIEHVQSTPALTPEEKQDIIDKVEDSGAWELFQKYIEDYDTAGDPPAVSQDDWSFAQVLEECYDIIYPVEFDTDESGQILPLSPRRAYDRWVFQSLYNHHMSLNDILYRARVYGEQHHAIIVSDIVEGMETDFDKTGMRSFTDWVAKDAAGEFNYNYWKSKNLI